MKKQKAKGVRFHVTCEMIKEYRKWPAAARIAWLQQAILLSYYGLTKKRRRIWEKFRKGEI